MLKAGIYVDSENLGRNGGRGLRYDTILRLVEAQGAAVLRASAYVAIDRQREAADEPYRLGKENHRNAIRRSGFHLVLKEARHYRNEAGDDVVKANADVDLAVDALLHAEHLDYVLLGTGDGDFSRLVRALQDKGRRVDVLSFANVNGDLRREADHHFCGFLVPGLVPGRGARRIGVIHHVDERGFGYITVREGLGLNDVRTDVEVRIEDIRIDSRPVDPEDFLDLKTREVLMEFDLVAADGKARAKAVTNFRWS